MALLLPITFNPVGQNAFELPKTILIVSLVMLGIAGALVDLGHRGRQAGGREKWVSRAVVLMACALLLATLRSVAPHTSLWGSYPRQQGLLTWAGYLGLFCLTAAGLRRRRDVDRLWQAMVWGSAPVALYGLLQVAGLDPYSWRTDAASPVHATLGRANFMGEYIVLVTPLTIGRLLVSKRRWPLVALLAGQGICLAATLARGAWLGLASGLLFLGWGWSVVRKSQRLRRWALGIVALAAAFVITLNIRDGPLDALSTFPGLDRLSQLGQMDRGSQAARLTVWKATYELIAERPWFGYGPETLHPTFMRVYPPQLVYYQGRQVVTDRAHNLWLDMAVCAGAAGVVALASLLVSFGAVVWKGIRCARDRWAQAVWIAICAAVIGHLVSMQVSFQTTTTATLFWLLVALGTGLYRVETHRSMPDAPCHDTERFGTSVWRYVPPLLAALWLVAWVGGRRLLADAAFLNAQRMGLGQPVRHAQAGRAVRLWPFEVEYRLGLAWFDATAGASEMAEVQLQAVNRVSPRDPRVAAAWGELHATLKEYDLAAAAYRKAVDLAPTIASLHTSLGLALAHNGRLEEGIVQVERAVDLDATDFAAHDHLASLYLVAGRDEDAKRARQQALYWAETTRLD